MIRNKITQKDIKNKKINEIFGIDLGTTNSVIAYLVDGANPVIQENFYGERIIPSIVAYTEKEENSKKAGTQLIGTSAKRQNILNPFNTFYSVKRFIGCKYMDIKNEIPKVSYKIKPGIDGTLRLFCPILNTYFSPEDISAIILKELISNVYRDTKIKCNKIVLTVPAYFNDSQRNATQHAATIAGLQVLRIINEPTAAALAYGFDKKKNEILFIFDLGGGTFDVSILETSESMFEVLATSGDIHLGGDDFDRVLVDYIVNKFKLVHGIDLSEDKDALQRILFICEAAKKTLSDLESAKIYLPYLYRHEETIPPKPIKSTFSTKTVTTLITVNEELSRGEFNKLTEHLVVKCLPPINDALLSSNIKTNNIDKVILVGGSSKIPAVRELVKKALNVNVLKESVNPDEAVALGAAVQAGIVSGEIKDLILLDVTPLSLGVAVYGGLMVRIIPKNSPIPIRKSQLFNTKCENTERAKQFVDITILQGEKEYIYDNKIVGKFRLVWNRSHNMVPIIKITFDINTDGILSVSACEQHSGSESGITITNAMHLSKEIMNTKEMLDKFFIEFMIMFNTCNSMLGYENFNIDTGYFEYINHLINFMNVNLNSNSLNTNNNNIGYTYCLLNLFKLLQIFYCVIFENKNIISEKTSTNID